MIHKSITCLVLFVALSLCGAVHAQIVFNNFPAYSSGGPSINTLSGPIAAPFTFSTGTYSLGPIAVSLEKYSWPLEFKVELYTGSGSPQTKLGTFAASALANGVQQTVTLTPQSFDPICGGQTYWLVFTETLAGGPQGLLLYSTSNGDSAGGLVSTGSIQYNSGSWSVGVNRVAAMQIQATAIPEPATTVSILAAAVFAVVLVVRRRRCCILTT
jgi:hypothetical protein